MNITTVGIDLAKDVITVYAQDTQGKCVLSRNFRFKELARMAGATARGLRNRHGSIGYGMIAERGAVVATKLLKRNRHMDFALYLGGLDDDAIAKVITECIGLCLEESVLRQKIAEGKFTPRGFLRSTRII